MLAVFSKQLARHPPELLSPDGGLPPAGRTSRRQQPKTAGEILSDFQSSHSGEAPITISFDGAAALAYSTGGVSYRRAFCSVDGISCVFAGELDNLGELLRHYGLSGRAGSADEAVLVIEAYRTLRDRGPYPADQVVRDLQGRFAFVLFDSAGAGASFAALDVSGGIPLFWGVAADGSVVIGDDRDAVKNGCGKSYAPFPAGCMFHSEGGLRSFEHPKNPVKPMPRVDSEGVMCGASFGVDTVTTITLMPRVGSGANWSGWSDAGL